MTTLVAGDTLYFRGGSYHINAGGGVYGHHHQLIYPSNSGTALAPITLQAYPGETVNIINDGSYPLLGSDHPTRNYIR